MNSWPCTTVPPGNKRWWCRSTSCRHRTSRKRPATAPGQAAPKERIACRSCQGLVRAVAKRLVVGVLAGAEPVVAFLGRRVLHRREEAALVAAVAKRLVFALAAGAPPVVLSGLQHHFRWRPRRDNRLGHVAFPVAAALLRCRANPFPGGV